MHTYIYIYIMYHDLNACHFEMFYSRSTLETHINDVHTTRNSIKLLSNFSLLVFSNSQFIIAHSFLAVLFMGVIASVWLHIAYACMCWSMDRLVVNPINYRSSLRFDSSILKMEFAFPRGFVLDPSGLFAFMFVSRSALILFL